MDDNPDDPGMPSKQRKLDNLGFTSGRSCDAARKVAINELIAKMISMHNLPIHMVEWQHFRELLKFVEPNFTPPCYETIKILIDEQAKKISKIIKSEIEESTSICLTTDAWTSTSNDSYLAVTASFITSEFDIKTPVLGTIFLDERHTSAYLGEKIEETVGEWGIHEKLTAIVHDNASNITHVGEGLANQAHDVNCAAHTLQLCIQEGMGFNKDEHPISNTVSAASRLVGRFNHSPMATMELNKRQLAMYPDRVPKKCIQQVKTRWNSIHTQFERLLELRWPIVAILSDSNVVKPADKKSIELKETQWSLMEDILPVLNKLKHANTLLCGEKYSTLSMLYPVLYNLLNHHLVTKDDNENADVIQFKNCVATKIRERFFKPINHLAAMATALDPRFKALTDFTALTQREIKTTIRQRVMRNFLDNDDTENVEPEDNDDDFFVASARPNKKTPKTAETECERYLGLQLVLLLFIMGPTQIK